MDKIELKVFGFKGLTFTVKSVNTKKIIKALEGFVRTRELRGCTYSLTAPGLGISTTGTIGACGLYDVIHALDN